MTTKTLSQTENVAGIVNIRCDGTGMRPRPILTKQPKKYPHTSCYAIENSLKRRKDHSRSDKLRGVERTIELQKIPKHYGHGIHKFQKRN